MNESQDLFEDIVSEEIDMTISPNLMGSSPVVLSGVSGEEEPLSLPDPANGTPKALDGEQSATTLQCDICSKLYKTARGLENHVFVFHKMSKFFSLKTDVMFIASILPDILCTVLEDMLKELDGENDKEWNQFLTLIKENNLSSSFSLFVQELCEIFSEALGGKCKLLPSNQYEEFLSNVNKLINSEDTFEKLRSKLLCIASGQNVNERTSGAILFRIILKLGDELYLNIVKESRTKSKAIANVRVVLTHEETMELKIHVERLLQSYVLRVGASRAEVWRRRCQCICQKLIESACDQSVSVQDMGNNKFIRGEGTLHLSPDALNFFVGIECCIKQLFIRKEPVTNENVCFELMKVENEEVLNLWQSITQELLPESDSMMFLRDMVSMYVLMSIRMEEYKLKRIQMETPEGLQQVALRTYLKRN